MKIISDHSEDSRWAKASLAGYTLVEMMFVAAIIVIIVTALFAAQLVGMRLDQLVQSKCGASDASRRTLQQLPVDIRQAKMWSVGNCGANGANFIQITNGAPPQGPALELFDTNSTTGTPYAIYYFTNYGGNVGAVLMKTLTSSGMTTVIASNLLYTPYFAVENYAGTPWTNSLAGVNLYKNIIHVDLQFYQFQYPLTSVGTNGLYDYYKLEFRATPHLPE